MTGDLRSLTTALEAINEQPPLVVSYTNSVTVDDVANITLHWGGLPVMSEDIREADEMVELAGACLLNMGTVNTTSEERMLAAGRAAANNNIPVVFDPVGVGATGTRTAVAERILDAVDVSIVKGNYGEISALAGSDAEVRGVESVGEYTEIATTAIACARKTDAVVVASGETDIIANQDTAYELSAGDPLMGQFVGSGCMLGVTLATVAGGLGMDDLLSSAIAGTAAFGIAGEWARAENWDGPASYKIAFLDTVAGMEPTDVSDIDLGDRLETIVTT